MKGYITKSNYNTLSKYAKIIETWMTDTQDTRTICRIHNVSPETIHHALDKFFTKPLETITLPQRDDERWPDIFKSRFSKMVLNTETGIYYDSIDEAKRSVDKSMYWKLVYYFQKSKNRKGPLLLV